MQSLLIVNLSTETSSIEVPANDPPAGVTNPSGAFCGACNLDEVLGCQSDQDCVDIGACFPGVDSGGCQFSTWTGAFGDDAATTIAVQGVRGPYLPRLAGVGCLGRTGDGTTDEIFGLPGPIRMVQQQLNAFEY